MGEAYWAAREGDILLHTSLLADIAGAAVEIACYAAIATACIAAAAVAIGLFTTTGGAAALALGAVLGTASTSACVVGTIVSVGVSIALEKYISQAADWVSSLFPPSEDGKIKTGSHNTRTNSKHSARAAGIVKKAETTQAPQQPEGFIDTAANILQGLKTAASQFIRPTGIRVQLNPEMTIKSPVKNTRLLSPISACQVRRHWVFWSLDLALSVPQ